MATKKQEKPLIHLEDITKEYTSLDLVTQILKGISVSIKRGEFVAITGPSGSGKSTLMNILGLLDVPTSGKYFLDGADVTGLSEDMLSSVRNKNIGFVFQSFNLLARSSALENVILPSIYAGMHEKERVKRGEELLTKVGLENRMKNRPNQLSGGQQQRVAIARALMNDPELILADEPTGNLDSKSGHDVMEILKDLNKNGRTIILITHEKEVAAVARRIITIKDGRVV